MTAHPRRALFAALLLALFLTTALLTGCSNEIPATPAATRTPVPGVGEVTTDAAGVQAITLETGDDYVFTPNTFTVAPGTVRLTVTNVGDQFTHNFEFTPDTGPVPISESIPLVSPGQTQTIEFTVMTPGDYPFDCSFHIRLGQVGMMTVSG